MSRFMHLNAGVMLVSVVLLVTLVFTSIPLTNGLIHKLKIERDHRQSFLIEGFGFAKGGRLEMNVSNWKINEQPLDPDDTSIVYANAFIVKITETDGSPYLEEINYNNCTIDYEKSDASVIFDGNPTTKILFVDGTDYQEGFYNLFFINCNLGTTVSFDLDLIEYNVESNGDINYLSIGDTPLPTIYGLFSAIFFMLLVFWAFIYLRGEGKRVNKVHHLWSAYLFIQAVSLLFEAIEKHYIKTTGYANGWDIAYYIFACLQGFFFIILIALVGTGWSFIKPFLSDKDKTVFMIVIPLQILDNIALIMIDEEAPGSVSFASWKHIFTVVDIICCLAIIAPIFWSIKHLKDASQVDDKAAQNLQKLKLFRKFYLFVIAYIYFTRIIVFLLKETLPYHYIWLGEFFILLASLIFYVATGYQFRPSLDNPYFHLPQHDDESGIPMEERIINDDE